MTKRSRREDPILGGSESFKEIESLKLELQSLIQMLGEKWRRRMKREGVGGRENLFEEQMRQKG
jgi:hypothetical protein